MKYFNVFVKYILSYVENEKESELTNLFCGAESFVLICQMQT